MVNIYSFILYHNNHIIYFVQHYRHGVYICEELFYFAFLFCCILTDKWFKIFYIIVLYLDFLNIHICVYCGYDHYYSC